MEEPKDRKWDLTVKEDLALKCYLALIMSPDEGGQPSLAFEYAESFLIELDRRREE